MKAPNMKKHNFFGINGNRIASIGSLVVCLFAMIAMIISIYNVNKVNENNKTFFQHPYKSVQTINNITNSLSEMRVHMEQLYSNYSENDYIFVADAIAQLKPGLLENLDFIIENYTGSQQDTLKLKNVIYQILEKQDILLVLLKNDGPLLTGGQYLHDLGDLYEQAMNVSDIIVSHGFNLSSQLSEDIESTAQENTIFSIALTVAIIVTTLIFQRTIQKKNQEIYTREYLFSLLSDTIDEVFIIYHNKNNTTDFISTNSERILGIGKEELINKNALMPYFNEEAKQLIHKHFFSKNIKETTQCEVLFTNPKSKLQQWLMIRAYPIIIDTEVDRYIVSISDLTNYKNTQQALRDALESAQRANLAKRDFLSHMSHEIRTPMNAIIGMTTIAASAINDPQKMESCISKIAYSSKHLLYIINDVLDMSAIESGKLNIAHEAFGLQKALQDVAILYDAQCAQNHQHFEMAIKGDIEETLIGDQVRLKQILFNLLSNAVKFTPVDGNISLKVQQLAKKRNRVFLRFEVVDTGIGIEEDFLNRIFEPFEQENKPTSQYQHGTGLGLAITKNLITLMGGTIHVKSKEQHGTTFRVDLPFDCLEQKLDKMQNQVLNDLKVLVVDDDEGTCEHAALILKRIGVHANYVLSGQEAIEIVVKSHEAQNDYDVCLIDWKMPMLDGIETTRKIREKVGPETLIIIISAYDWASIETKARQAGANAFISKPFFQSSLFNVLMDVTGKQRALQEKNIIKYDFNKQQILLAEDNPLNMEIAVELLSQTNAQVDTAANGKEVLDMFLNSEPKTYDVILMDVQMPQMDGYTATRQIRASNHADAKTIPIYAMTANAFSEDVSASLAAGMNGHISKPIDTFVLYSTLQNCFSESETN